MKTIKVPLDKLVLDIENANKHDDKSIQVIKSSLAKFGQQKNIVINKDNVVIAGNGTLIAARELDWPHLDCYVSTLTKSELKAYALVDNRSAEFGQWNVDLLGEQLNELTEDSWDVLDLGFNANEVKLDKDEGFEFSPPSDEDQVDTIDLRVFFDDMEQKENLYAELKQRGFKVQ